MDRPEDDREAVEDVWASLRDWATWVPQAGEPVVWLTDS
jgi:hypothetical protein